MMDGKQLRNSILQWAIQGKLVPQDPNDEPASVLLERIREEKARLVKEKKIKRDKNESIIYRGEDNSYYEKFLATGEVKCIDDEIPFDLPFSWKWARIRDISQSYIGLTYSPANIVKKGGTIVLRSSNIKSGKLDLQDIVRVDKPIAEKLKVELNDIIICARNGSKRLVGKSALVTDVPEAMTFGAFMAICKTQLFKYVYLFLQSDLFFGQLREVSSTTTINQLTQNNFNGFLIPIPPFNEQERIVERYTELCPIIDRYGVAQNRLNDLNCNINQSIKKSILQQAIQGLLVEQNPDDDPASVLLEKIKAEKERLIKEKKIKRDKQESIIYRGDDNKYYENLNGVVIDVTDKIPFDIPNSWQWVRLEQICSYIQRGKSPKYSPIRKYPVVAQKCNQWSGFFIEKALFIDPHTVSSYQEERILCEGDLLWNSTGLGTLGRMAIYKESLNPYGWAVADSHVTVIRAMNGICAEYLYYYFTSPTVQSVIEDKSDGSTKQKELSTNTVKSYYVPLPPHNEQLRIIQKITSLFQLSD